ncbi:MAG: cation:proton antiporter [Bacteroidales bacterium]|nr:cation:proton antiporter [Bacteroidales bacterium]
MTLPLQQPVAIFLLVLIMILLTPVLLRRLGIPHIVGMILAGIVVGPHGFGLLARDSSFEIFGQVGILYLMFLAGVEIDMLGLQRNWKSGVKFGLLSFLLPVAGGLLVSRYLMDCSWLTSALIASMLGSHTLISYPIVARFGLTASRASVIAVCGTIVAVLLALVLLAAVVGVQTSGNFRVADLLRLGLWTVIYAAGIWWSFGWMTRRFFRQFSDRVTQFIFILAEVLLASLLAQLIGLEAILGAFYAGLVLNRFVPSRSGLMSRLEFVGNAIFIPYFLIGVGMLMDVTVIFRSWDVIRLALLMSLTALICKWIAAMVATRQFHLQRYDRQLIFGLTSGKAAATIAATIIGYRCGLISEDVMNGAVIMILICCAVASVVTEKAAKILRLDIARQRMERDGGGGRAKMARQLVAVANPLTAEGIMRVALYMRHPANTHHITGLFIKTGDDATIASMGHTALKSITQVALSVDVKVDEIERYDVNIVAGLTNAMKEHNCSEIILGLHRKSNIVDTFLGSMLEQLLRTTNKMVMMSRIFVPVNTLRRQVIIVPAKAEYETGFSLWLTRVCMLSQQVGSRMLFIAYPETIRYIQGAINTMGFELRIKFLALEAWDDIITASADITDDDLLTVICARKTSVSYSSDLEMLPSYLSRYFARHNLMIVYPEQFGPEAELPTPIDPLSTSIASSPGGWSWHKLFHR